MDVLTGKITENPYLNVTEGQFNSLTILLKTSNLGILSIFSVCLKREDSCFSELYDTFVNFQKKEIEKLEILREKEEELGNNLRDMRQTFIETKEKESKQLDELIEYTLDELNESKRKICRLKGLQMSSEKEKKEEVDEVSEYSLNDL